MSVPELALAIAGGIVLAVGVLIVVAEVVWCVRSYVWVRRECAGVGTVRWRRGGWWCCGW